VLRLGGARSALVIRLLKGHAGLPAGTLVRVAFATPHGAAIRRVTFAHADATALLRIAKPRSNGHASRRASRPLTITPPLGPDRYVFPVAGHPSFVDSYGGFRPDVSGNWHHGDDLFAPLGTPVVAVASGTLNRVGWEALGGWRLWIRDRHRNEFYYAHLSGYSPLALKARRVRAGDVIGFVGNTGDAFTTPPHLHFEIHPHQLLHLHYDGAVNPTGYLERWRHLEHVHAPKPLLAPLPDGEAAQEARYVFAELRTARGLTRKPAGRPPHIRPPALDRAFSSIESVPTERTASPLPLILILIAGGIGFTGCGAAVVALRRRS
jgi:hypothetical protein